MAGRKKTWSARVFMRSITLYPGPEGRLKLSLRLNADSGAHADRSVQVLMTVEETESLRRFLNNSYEYRNPPTNP